MPDLPNTKNYSNLSLFLTTKNKVHMEENLFMGAAILDMERFEHRASKCLNSDKIHFYALLYEFLKIFICSIPLYMFQMLLF